MDWSGADEGAVVAGVAGASLVLAAVGWWAVTRLRTRRMVARGLRDPDPAVRAAVVAAVAGSGVRAHARRLLVLAHGEDDAEVRAALAAAVVRSQWEPATDPRLLALRVWAHEVTASANPRPDGEARFGRAAPFPVAMAPPGPEPVDLDRTRPDVVAPVG